MPNPHDFHTPQQPYTRDELLRSSDGGYFGPGNAQLPAPPMLMMDRITEISLDGGEFGKGHIVGELDIEPGHWFFDCHYRGDAMMPGSLGLDAMWQMIGYWLGWSGSPGKGRAIGVGEVEAAGLVTPETRRVRYGSPCVWSGAASWCSELPTVVCLPTASVSSRRRICGSA
ncbi:3-hydroxyacyl-[acyl-carrier protein] dehydratase/trans-2-decenoyl-[acyl-carrier protein] isomerase [Bradyrhizobium sp. LA6.1]